MARRTDGLDKALEGLLGERRKVAQSERKVVQALNRALKKIGYQAVPIGRGEAPKRRRRGRRAVARKRRRPRSKK